MEEIVKISESLPRVSLVYCGDDFHASMQLESEPGEVEAASWCRAEEIFVEFKKFENFCKIEKKVKQSARTQRTKIERNNFYCFDLQKCRKVQQFSDWKAISIHHLCWKTLKVIKQRKELCLSRKERNELKHGKSTKPKESQNIKSRNTWLIVNKLITHYQSIKTETPLLLF